MVRPFWFDVLAAVLPIAIAIVFRKQMQRIMRWVWLALFAGLVGRIALKMTGN